MHDSANRFLILGDSLPSHRSRAGISLSQTWPELLKQASPTLNILNRSRWRATSREVLREFRFFSDSLDHFDAIIIQCGIVDAVPRPMSHRLQRFVWEFFPVALERIFNAIVYGLPSWFPRHSWLSPQQYHGNLLEVVSTAVSRNPTIMIVMIPILPAGRGMSQIFPGVEELIARFNNELLSLVLKFSEKKVYLLDSYSSLDIEELTTHDGHHLSVMGHRIVADSLSKLFVLPRVTGRTLEKGHGDAGVCSKMTA